MILRISASAKNDSEFIVAARAEGRTGVVTEAAGVLQFHLPHSLREEMRWYWEQFADSPSDPAPRMAARVEDAIAATGQRLFAQLFGADEGLAAVWATVAAHLSKLRIEIEAGDIEASLLPWELMRTPDGRRLALDAREFVRIAAPASPSGRRSPPGPRVLIVISRPMAAEDVGYQTMAREIVGELMQSPVPLAMSVLRPPTFEHLTTVLRRYFEDGEPFDLVHFDGHGEFLDADEAAKVTTVSAPGSTPRGYLLFERDFIDRTTGQVTHEPIYVNGAELGEVLAQYGVRAVVLNACRSAYSAGLGSLADELGGAGLDAVIAMRYSVYVDSAARFMKSFYRHLMRGRTASAAVTAARRDLDRDAPIVAHDGRPLQDWPVPVLLERSAVQLVPRKRRSAGTAPPTKPAWSRARAQEDAILWLDRLFDLTPVVCLHGMAGAGKSAIARQFVDWYHRAGGAFRVIWIDAVAKVSVRQVLSEAANVLRQELDDAGYRWEGVHGASAQADALRDVMWDIPLLWVWDGVDDLVATMRGESTAYHPGEANNLRELVAFFEGRFTKWLFTCQGDIAAWLPGSHTHVSVQGVHEGDAVRLLNELAGSTLSPADAAEQFRPVVEWAGGNPRALRVAASALSGEFGGDAAAFLDAARRGELEAPAAELEPVLRAGRALCDRLDAPSNAGISRRLRTAALYDGEITPFMLPLKWDVGGGAREKEENEWERLFAECARSGLARDTAPLWRMHPLFPVAIRHLRHGTSDAALAAEHEDYLSGVVFSALALHDGFNHGQRELAAVASTAAPVFERALRETLARQRWKDAVMVLQGLWVAWVHHKGDRQHWLSLLEEVLDAFVDRSTMTMRSGRVEQAALVLTMYALALGDVGRPDEAESVLNTTLAYHRAQTAPIRPRPSTSWTKKDRLELRWLCDALSNAATHVMKRNDPGCIPMLEEAYEVGQAISHPLGPLSLNLGLAYLVAANPPDFGKAEFYLQRSLNERPDDDTLGRARVHAQLGGMYLKRWHGQGPLPRPEVEEVMRRGQAALEEWLTERTADLQRAVESSERAIELLPHVPHPELHGAYFHAAEALAKMHMVTLWGQRSSPYLDSVLDYFARAIDVAEGLGNDELAAKTRLTFAKNLLWADRRAPARDYAVSALVRFQALGAAALDDQLDTLKVLAEIDAPPAAT